MARHDRALGQLHEVQLQEGSREMPEGYSRFDPWSSLGSSLRGGNGSEEES